jgi:hypothetical protein
MRVRAALLALAITLPAVASAEPISPGKAAPDASSASHCPRTTSYLAGQSSIYQGKPPAPRRLTELPSATTYMAVLRHIGGCEAPLTMVEYRNPRRR